MSNFIVSYNETPEGRAYQAQDQESMQLLDMVEEMARRHFASLPTPTEVFAEVVGDKDVIFYQAKGSAKSWSDFGAKLAGFKALYVRTLPI